MRLLTGNQMDTHLKDTVHSYAFSRAEGIEDVFDKGAREEVDRRCEIIRDEYARGDTPIIEPQLEVPYTKKEMKRAMRKLKEKYWKPTGLDGVRSWMIDKAGDTFLNFLLEFCNKCWGQGEIPSDWYATLISYIYKSKGKLQELTSSRPIALTTCSMLVNNIFKTMWLQRLVSVVDKHLSHCQGGSELVLG